jgi:hypothetical protein
MTATAVRLHQLPARDRALLLVATDEKYDELRRLNQQRIAFLPNAPVGLLGAALVRGLLRAEQHLGPHRLRDAIAKFREDWGSLKMLRLIPQEAMEQFTFAEEPQDGSLFRVNPFNNRQYLPPATYTEHVAREKVGAFIRIASTLGAKELRLVSASVERSLWRGKASLIDVAVRIGLAAQFNDDRQLQQCAYAGFDKPDRVPFAPPELQGWIDSTPEIRALVQNRLDGRPHNLTCHLVLSGSSTSEAKAVAGWDSIGLNVGGSHQRLFSSTWRFEIEFWP